MTNATLTVGLSRSVVSTTRWQDVSGVTVVAGCLCLLSAGLAIALRTSRSGATAEGA